MKRKTGGKLSTNCEFLVVEGLDSGNETNTIKIKKHNRFVPSLIDTDLQEEDIKKRKNVLTNE